MAAKAESGRQPKRRALTATVLAVSAVVLLVACGGPEPPPLIVVGDQGLTRLLAEEPQHQLDRRDVTRVSRVERWPIRSDEWATRWSGEGLFIDHEVDLDADTIHGFEVEAVEDASLHLRLFWAGEQEEYDQERSAPLRSVAKRKNSGAAFSVDLTPVHAWSGRIARLRLSATGSIADVSKIEALVGLRAGIEWSKVKTARHSAWKVELGGEHRDGIPAPPGLAHDFQLQVAGSCRFQVSFGLPAGVRRPVNFRATATDDAGEETVLLEERIDPTADNVDRWWERSAALDRWQGGEIRVTLETDAAVDFDLARGIPVWANPVVLTDGGGPDERLNVLLISVDTLRADHMSLYGYEKPTTPRLERWARRNATVFSSVVAPSPWTLPSHVSLFTGLDAVRHGINHDVGGLGAPTGADAVLSLEMLAEVLRRSGYETAAITGGAYLDPKYGFAQGFDSYYTWPDRAQDAHELEAGVDRALAWMAGKTDSPFFLFLHTYAVHDPYRARGAVFDRVAPEGVSAPDGTFALVSPKNSADNGFQQINRFVFRPRGDLPSDLEMNEEGRNLVTAAYDSGIGYMDAQIGRLLQTLRAEGLSARTLIILTSDHGESLGERGQAGHVFLTDDNLMVPLLIADPLRRGVGRVVAEQVRLIDVAPTVLDLLDLSFETPTDGVSLAPMLEGKSDVVPPHAWSYAAASNRGLSLRTGGGLKFMVNTTAWAPVAGDLALFDLAADPREIRDLATDDPRVDELYDASMSYLHQSATGLRLRIRSGSGSIRGRLKSPSVRPVGTKAAEMTGPFVSWVTMGEAAIDVPPENDFTLHFEKVFGRRFNIEGVVAEGSAESRFDTTFNVRDLEGVEALVLVDGRWRRVTRELADDEVGFSIRWHGDVVIGGPSAATDDAELAEQLRALGYVE